MNPSAFTALPSSACTLGTAGSFGPDRITRNTYDAAGQLLQVQRAYGTPIQQDYATYTYTTNGQRQTIKDANSNLTTLEYDGFDRLAKMRFPVVTSGANQSSTTDYEQYGYDTVGNRTTLRKRDGKTITFAYDALNRVRLKTVPTSTSGAPGYSVYYGYDVRGLQLFARFSSTSGAGVTNTYDGFGGLRSSSTSLDGVTRAVVSDYDAQGNRSRITHPDGAYFEYRYDPASRLTQLTENGPSTPLALLTYDTQGRRDAIGRDTAGAATGFGYDALSRLGAIVHNLDGGGTSNDLTTTFNYNPASQIVTRAQSNNAYEFPVGSSNRAYVTNGRNQYTQITGDAPATLNSDANGNLTSDGSTAFGYDTENRLTSASGAKSATLTYDPLGRLYQVTSAGVTTRFVYDGDRLIAEYNTAGTVQRRYVHGAAVDEPLVWYEGASVSSASRRYLHANHQRSIIATSNAAGARLETGTYDAYGVTTAPSTWRFQYTGQAAIPQLGLYYYKARFYNPALGRFMQTDPIGYDDDLNLYAYVGGDPINRIDPLGTDTYTLSGALDIFISPGFGVDLGVYFNPGFARGENFDVGVFGGGRVGFGGDLSIGVNAGRIRGSAESINGGSLNAQVGVAIFTYQRTWIPTPDANGQYGNDAIRRDSVGVSLSPMPVSGNATGGWSKKFGFQDIKSLLGQAFGGALKNAGGATVTYDAKSGVATAKFDPKTGTRIRPSDMKICVDQSKCEK